ncbi:MAG: molecular chaperone DnaJ [Planctomycetota bacterium]
MTTKRDYYEVLGVTRESGDDEIKKSYRTLAMKYHPDRNAGDEEASVYFKEAAEAYAVLSDPQKRQVYDRYGHAGLGQMGGMPDFGGGESVFEMFGDIFEMFTGGNKRRRGPRAGDDLGYRLEIDLVEAYRGARKSIVIPRNEPCGECSGTGSKKGSKPAQCRTCQGSGVTIQSQGFFRVQQKCRTCGGRGQIITDPCNVCQGRARVQVKRTIEVDIPPGAGTGMRFGMQGEGEAGEPGGPRGNLIIEVLVRDHPLFRREGDHLICQVPVTFSQAALGGEIDIPTLDGPLKRDIPKGSQSGDILRIAGKGMPSARGGRRGELLVQLMLETPRTLTKRQEELFRELAELDKSHVSPQRTSFFDKIRDLFVGHDEPDKKS